MALDSKTTSITLLIIALLPLVISIRTMNSASSRNDYGYKEGELIPLFASTIGALEDPCGAIHSYFEFPFCPPGDPIYRRKKTIEEILSGDCWTRTKYELKFKKGTLGEVLCEKNLSQDEVAKFKDAVESKFSYEMYFNNIPLQGVLGKVEKEDSRFRIYLVRHIRFYPYYYKNQVIDIHSVSDFDSAVDITKNVAMKINFTYSVFWKEFKVNQTNLKFGNQMTMKKVGLYTEEQPGQGIVLSVLSLLLFGSITVIWLGLLLVVIVPYLRSYFNRYSRGNSSSQVVISVHHDACIRPPYSSLLGAILGIGIQLFILMCSLFFLAYQGVMRPCYPEPLFPYLLLMYCLTSAVSGYKATTFHSQYAASGWKECIFQTGVLSLVPMLLMAVLFTTLPTIGFKLPNPIEFGTAIKFFLKWGLGTTFCLTLGGVSGYVLSQSQEPFATNQTQREIPSTSQLTSTPVQMFIGGFLPFLIMFPYMDEIYTSLWNMKVCGAFGTLLVSFIIVIALTISVGMGFTFYQLSNQDLNWWWRSVLRGGSTALFMFAYGIYFFFHARIGTAGFMELLLFMGYNACVFYSFFLVLGTIGYYASSYVYDGMFTRVHKHE